jgi:dihydroorotate dehydrogenase
MGFNNHGAKAVAPRLIGLRRTIVGVNIGKTRRVREDAAVADYQSTARALVPHADFLVVNVSSPNTSGLRNLQAVDKLRPLLVAIKSVMIQTCADAPLLVKIAPDTSDEEIDAICDLALELGLDGIVATNTTVSRRGLRTDPERIRNIGDGGVSGAPLGARALSVLRRIHSRTGARLCIISVGGIETARDVWERLQSGATLVQLYSSLIYEGPGLVAKIHAGLLEHLEREGIDSIKQVVGRHAASRDSESSPRRGTGPVSTSARA